MGETVAQAEARAAALQYKDIDHNYFCLFLIAGQNAWGRYWSI